MIRTPPTLTRASAVELWGERGFREARKGGHLLEYFKGIYGNPGALADWGCEVKAVWDWAGPRAVLSHTTAAHLLGLDLPGRVEIELTVPRKTRLKKIQRARLHRAIVPPSEITEVSWVPCTRAEFTIVELADRFTRPVDLAVLVDSAWRLQPKTFLKQMTAVTSRNTRGRKGTANLRTVLEECQERQKPLRSSFEVEFWYFLREHQRRVPLPRPLHEVSDRFGGLEIDFAWPDRRLAVETAGWRYHKAKWESDARRRTRLVALGYRVIDVTYREFDKNRFRALEQIEEALADPFFAPR